MQVGALGGAGGAVWAVISSSLVFMFYFCLVYCLQLCWVVSRQPKAIKPRSPCE